jgi:hypothetical protein
VKNSNSAAPGHKEIRHKPRLVPFPSRKIFTALRVAAGPFLPLLTNSIDLIYNQELAVTKQDYTLYVP